MTGRALDVIKPVTRIAHDEVPPPFRLRVVLRRRGCSRCSAIVSSRSPLTGGRRTPSGVVIRSPPKTPKTAAAITCSHRGQVSCLLTPAMTEPFRHLSLPNPVPAQGATIGRSRTAGRYQAVNRPRPSAPSLRRPN
jgi:hypothetical protein